MKKDKIPRSVNRGPSVLQHCVPCHRVPKTKDWQFVCYCSGKKFKIHILFLNCWRTIITTVFWCWLSPYIDKIYKKNQTKPINLNKILVLHNIIVLNSNIKKLSYREGSSKTYCKGYLINFIKKSTQLPGSN